MGDEFNYGAALIRDLGSLGDGGKIKLTTETGRKRDRPVRRPGLRRLRLHAHEALPGAPAVRVTGTGEEKL